MSDEAAYREARDWYRLLGNAELLALHESLAYELAECEAAEAPAGWREAVAALHRPRLRAATDELARRRRLAAGSRSLAEPSADRYDAWTGLARRLRDQADITEVFRRAGRPLFWAGGGECAGPCLACGGTDRLRVWPGPPGRYWCRRCGLTGDVITAARSLLDPTFSGALGILAEMAGVGPPAGPDRGAEGAREHPGGQGHPVSAATPPTAANGAEPRTAPPWAATGEPGPRPRPATPPRFELRAGQIARR